MSQLAMKQFPIDVNLFNGNKIANVKASQSYKKLSPIVYKLGNADKSTLSKFQQLSKK